MSGAFIAPLCAAHFIPVWNGNPFNPMTICVTDTKISGITMVSGDEVGIFDGADCVGRGILTQVINPSASSTFLYISCSKDDPGTPTVDGFTEGHSIVYKLWKQSTNVETEYVTHTFPYAPSFVFETFSPNETVVVGLNAVNVPATRLLQNMTVSSGQTVCYDAVQSIAVAGNSTFFQVAQGGNVTMIAGTMISFLPGTTVTAGGYLRGYISTNGLFCGGQAPVAPMNIETAGQDSVTRGILINIFPNPNSGRFRVNVISGKLSKIYSMEIFSMKGEKVLQRSISAADNNHFDMEDLPGGIYLIRVLSGTESAFAKLIRQ